MKLTPQQRLKLAVLRPDIAKILEQQEQTELLSKVTQLKGDKGDTGASGKDSTVPGPMGERGEIGPKGDRGERGLAGRDGRDGLDGRDGQNGLTPVVDYQKILNELKKEIKNGIDGKDAVVDEKMIKKVLDPHIKQLHNRIGAAIEGMPRGSNYGGFIETAIKAGANTTVSKDATGSWVISSTGGGVSTWSTPPESPDPDVGTTVFTVGTTAPTDVIADGTTLFEGFGYTYTSPIITLRNGATQFVRFR
jgi:hypothetical protein